MHGILDWGVNVVLWLQRFSPALDLPFKAFTFLGEEEFLILFIPFVFWCLDRRSGARLAFLFLFSAFVASVIKVLTAEPRPFLYDARVQKLFEAGGYGFPSQHTQSTLVVWGFLAITFKRAWLWVLAGILVVFVPLSRIYLGVHYPSDVLGSLTFAALWLLVVFVIRDRYARRAGQP
jgi:membrane-associated phospholipid phosphatase